MKEEGEDVADKTRVAVRISNEYLLRSLQLLSQLTGDDLVTGLVSLAIVQANVAELDRNSTFVDRFTDTDDLPPDQVRRPVSVLAIATSLGLPYETTRRHVAKLAALGACTRVKGGVIVPSSALGSELHKKLLAANLVNLRRMFRSLRKAGIDLD